MKKFLEKLGDKDICLQKPDIVAFLVLGRDGDILLSSCDYINNIRPALDELVAGLKEKDEEMSLYVEKALFYVVAAAAVSDVFNQEQKCIVGSCISHSACVQTEFVDTVGGLLEAGDELACGKIQEVVYSIYEKDTESA